MEVCLFVEWGEEVRKLPVTFHWIDLRDIYDCFEEAWERESSCGSKKSHLCSSLTNCVSYRNIH